MPTSIAFLFVEAGFTGCAVEFQTEHGQIITVRDADCDEPFSEAVIATVDSPLGGVLSALTGKVAAVEEAGTVTAAGTVRTELLGESETTTAPLGAAESVTVQVLLAPASRLVGLQATPLTRMGATRVRLAVWVELFKVAVTVALWVVVRVPAVAVKVAEVAEAATVTEAGTVRAELLLDNVTVLPPLGAG